MSVNGSKIGVSKGSVVRTMVGIEGGETDVAAPGQKYMMRMENNQWKCGEE